MNNQQAYNEWSSSYNDVVNLTRDTELKAKQEILKNISFTNVLELGCGTGKNTEWLSHIAKKITAVDFSNNMLGLAKSKDYKNEVNFIAADINEPWLFVQDAVDLITCSLVLEHIEHLEPIFQKAGAALLPGGFLYIGELHPYKQYVGSKARFQKDNQTIVLDCFIHSTANYITLALKYHFSLLIIKEWQDEKIVNDTPRILTLLFKKNSF